MRNTDISNVELVMAEARTVKEEDYVDFLRRSFKSLYRIKTSSAPHAMRISLEMPVIDRVREGRVVAQLVRESFKERMQLMKETSSQNLSRNYHAFVTQEIPFLEIQLDILKRVAYGHHWTRARRAFQKVFQTRLQMLHPLEPISEDRLELMADCRGEEPVSSVMIRMTGIDAESILDMQTFYGVKSLNGMLTEVFLRSKSKRKQSEESKMICKDLSTLMSSIDTYTDKELLEELVWLSKDYGRRRKANNAPVSTSRPLKISVANYKELHGETPSPLVIDVRMDEFSAGAVPDMSKFNRGSVKSFVEAHLKSCSAVISEKAEQRRRLAYYNWLSEVISDCYQLDIERKLNFSEVGENCKFAHVPVDLYPKILDFQNQFGFFSISAVVHYLIDPERKFW